jgi:hypothetical protein
LAKKVCENEVQELGDIVHEKAFHIYIPFHHEWCFQAFFVPRESFRAGVS